MLIFVFYNRVIFIRNGRVVMIISMFINEREYLMQESFVNNLNNKTFCCEKESYSNLFVVRPDE